MKKLILISLSPLIVCSVLGQKIEKSLQIVPYTSDSISVNLKVTSGHFIEYLDHTYNIVNDTIYFSVCYEFAIISVITTVYNTLNLAISQEGAYVFNIKLYYSSSEDTCNYFYFRGSALLNFSFPLLDTINLSVVGLSNSIQVYPNLVNDVLQMDVGNIKIKDISLIDIQGRKRKSYHKTERQLDISNIAKGQYFLRIRTDKGTVNKKIIIE